MLITSLCCTIYARALATPTALAVGTFVAAALFPDSDPLLQWTMAAIAGGGTAGIVQAVTGITRLSSTALTIGLGNAVVASVESIGAITLSVLALVAPVIAIGACRNFTDSYLDPRFFKAERQAENDCKYFLLKAGVNYCN